MTANDPRFERPNLKRKLGDKAAGRSWPVLTKTLKKIVILLVPRLRTKPFVLEMSVLGLHQPVEGICFCKCGGEAIIQAAKGGEIYDSKIFVVDLDHVVSIRTGGTGEIALGERADHKAGPFRYGDLKVCN